METRSLPNASSTVTAIKNSTGIDIRQFKDYDIAFFLQDGIDKRKGGRTWLDVLEDFIDKNSINDEFDDLKLQNRAAYLLHQKIDAIERRLMADGEDENSIGVALWCWDENFNSICFTMARMAQAEM